MTRMALFTLGHRPPFEIPVDWWEDANTRNDLLDHEYKPPFDTPEGWWDDEYTRHALLSQGFSPSFDIPDDWWGDKRTRRVLRRRGYPPPAPYSTEDTASEGEDVESTEQPVSLQDQPLTSGKTSPGVASPSAPLAGFPTPMHIQPVASVTTPVENAGRRHRGFRAFLKRFLHW